MIVVQIFTYLIIVVNVVIDVLAIISFAQASTGNESNGIYSINSSCNAFAYIATVDLMFAWFFMFNSQWLQRYLFHQTLRENVWPHQILSACALIGYMLHGVFFMSNGQTNFNSSILDKNTSGLAAWCTIIVMSILLFRFRYYWFHLLMVPFLLFSFMHSYVMIGLLTPLILISILLFIRRPSTHRGQIIASQTTEFCTTFTIQSSTIDTRTYPLGSYFTMSIDEFGGNKNKRDMYAVPYHLANGQDVKSSNGKKLTKHPHRLCFYIQANQALSFEIHQHESSYATLMTEKESLKRIQAQHLSKIDQIRQIGYLLVVATGDQKQEPEAQQQPWSTSKQNKIIQKFESRLKKIKKRLNRINRELHALKKSKLSVRHVSLQGPYGGFLHLPDSLEKYRYIVIFAEQAGIIPLTIHLNNLLEILKKNDKDEEFDRIFIWLHWMCPERSSVCNKYQKIATKDEIRYAQFQPNFINFNRLEHLPSSSNQFSFKCTFYLTHMRRQIRPKFVSQIPTTSQLPVGHRFRLPANNIVSFVKNRGFNMKKILENIHQEILDKELQKNGNVEEQKQVERTISDENNDNESKNSNDPEIVNNTIPPTEPDHSNNDDSDRKRSLAVLYCGDEEDGMYDTCVRESKALNDLFLNVDFHHEPFYMNLSFDDVS